jgi:hypothetical protein
LNQNCVTTQAGTGPGSFFNVISAPGLNQLLLFAVVENSPETVVQSLVALPVAWAVARPKVWSVAQSMAKSVARSVALSVEWSVAHPLSRFSVFRFET